LTNASIRILIATLLIGFLPGVSASCWIDSSSGVEYCDGLSPAARAAIGLGFFFVFLAVLFGILGYRRRRLARANLVYVEQGRPGDGAAFVGNPYGYGGGSPPQYPPQAHYDPTTGFAPPGGSPPQYYPPPPGAPPFSSQK